MHTASVLRSFEVLRREGGLLSTREERIALCERLDEMLQPIRCERGIRPTMMGCPQCGRRHRSAEPGVSVRAMVLSLGRFGILTAQKPRRWRSRGKSTGKCTSWTCMDRRRVSLHPRVETKENTTRRTGRRESGDELEIGEHLFSYNLLAEIEIGKKMPNLAASAAVIRSGQILLTKRKDLEAWCLPGGHVDPGETVAQAAVREIYEETGLEIALIRLVGIYSAPKWHHGGDNVVLFAAAVTKGELKPQEDEVLEVCFFDPLQLPEPLLWWHQQRIQDALSGIGGSVARLQDMIWPFDPEWTRKEVFEFFAKSGLSKEEFYTNYWGQPGPDDGKVEVDEVREQ